MNIYTIGFTGKSAERFFNLLEAANTRRLIDARLNNRSQLAGFSKSDDLRFFLQRILDIPYRHAVELAPTQGMLDKYRKKGASWASYERSFNRLMEKRAIQDTLAPSEMDGRVSSAASTSRTGVIDGWWRSISSGAGRVWRFGTCCEHSPVPSGRDEILG